MRKVVPSLLRFSLPLALLVLLAAPRLGVYFSKSFGPRDLNLFNAKEIRDIHGKSIFVIDDTSYQPNRMPFDNDCVLSLNTPPDRLTKDDTRKYVIRHASYIFTTGHGVIGRGGGRFYKSDHRIEMVTDRNLWLGSCDDAGSFTLEIRLKPVSLRDGAVLFSRVGYNSGRKNGMEILIRENRVAVRLYGFFKTASGRRVDAFLNRGRVLRENRWYHFSLSFDRISGKLVRSLNGSEEEVIYASEKGEPYINVYEPSFLCEDKPVAVIGKNYFGYIDEFRISHRHIDDLKKETALALKRYRDLSLIDKTPVNKEGVITSPVYTFPSTGTMVKAFQWDEVIKENTFIWMEFRTSDEMFQRDEGWPKWYRINNAQRNIYLKMTEEGYYLRGKYYQWRAHLIPSPDGRHSPYLYNIRMNYELDPPPRSPLKVEAVKAGDEFVTLRWLKNVEKDLLGYKIYYGLHRRRYDGVITLIEGRRINNERAGRDNFIEITLNNKTIIENRDLDKRAVLRYPELKNTVLYFFAVSAYDNYKPDTPFNHESSLSKEVTARPFAGSEIDR